MKERIPPHSEEAERAVLGSAMLDKDVLLQILEEVTEEDFYNERHKEIFKAIHKLATSTGVVDLLTVSSELEKLKVLDMVGGRGYIAELTGTVPSVSNGIEYAKILTEKTILRKLIRTSEDITKRGYEEKRDADEILDYAESGIFKISQKRQKNDYAKLEDILVENLKTIDIASQNQGKIIGLPTGFKELDEKMSGLQRSDLIIVAARPAMGKTAFALNVALNTAFKSDASVLIFSLEMAKEQLGQRLLSMHSRIESQKLKNGNLDRKDWDRLTLAFDDLNKVKINIDDTPGISILEMRNKCRRLKAEQGLDLVIVDYLQLMSIKGRIENRQQEISTLSRNMKLLAREVDCPVIVLSQLSRAVEQRADHRPVLSDLRESGSIEQDADIVMFLYRDDVYNPNTEKPGVCEVNVSKHRSGPTGTVELTWVARYTKFSDKAY